MKVRRLAPLFGAIIIAGCAMNRSSLPSQSSPVQSVSVGFATVVMEIGGSGQQSVARNAKFVSAGTQTVAINVYAAGTTTPTIGAVVTDVSSGSAACVGVAPRTCTFGLPAPIGLDDFDFITYDAKPVSGKVAAGSHVLAEARQLGVSINPGMNTVGVTLNPVVGGYQPAAINGAFAAGCCGTQMSFAFTASTAAIPLETIPIVTGSPAPVGSPLPTLSITENAGSCGGANLMQGNVQYPDSTLSPTATSASPVPLAQAPVGLQLHIGQGGHPGPGYFATAKLSGVASNEVVTMSALTWSSTATQFVSNCNSPTGVPFMQFTAANQVATAAVNEHGNATPANFELINDCNAPSATVQMGAAVVAPGMVPAMTNLTLTLTAGPSLATAPCALFAIDTTSLNPALPQAEFDIVQGNGSGTITIP